MLSHCCVIWEKHSSTRSAETVLTLAIKNEEFGIVGWRCIHVEPLEVKKIAACDIKMRAARAV